MLTSKVISKGNFKVSANYKGKNTSVGSLYIQQARRLTRYVFRNYLVGIELNTELRKWNIMLDQKILEDPEMEEVKKDFLEYWSPFYWYFTYVINDGKDQIEEI